jgi:TatD DNase family protein
MLRVARRGTGFPAKRLMAAAAAGATAGAGAAPASEKLHFLEIAANLTDSMFSGVYHGRRSHAPDLDVVLARALDAGVVRTMVTAGTLAQSIDALALARTRADLFCTVGVHPTRGGEMAGRVAEHVDALLRVVEGGRGKVVAVGECGLDYDRTQFCSREDQKPAFVAQFELAERTGLPMFLHDRNTGGEFARVVREHRGRFSTGVVHSFTGTAEDLQRHLALDLYVGLNGCSLKTPENVAVAKMVPLDRLMLETDAPYCGIRATHAGFGDVLSTWPARDKKKWAADACVKGRSEPCHIRQVCEVVAAARGIEQTEVARAAFNNAVKVFFPSEVEGPSPYDLSVNAVQ